MHPIPSPVAVRSLARTVRAGLALSVAALSIPHSLAAQTADDVLDRILRAGLASESVVETYRTLTDVHGPRLSGTPALEAAAAYVRDRFGSWGLDARIEEFEFGRGWTLQELELEMVEPRYAPLHGYPEAWSPGTGGILEGDAVYLGERTADEIRAMGAELAGAIVLPYPPQPAFITEDRPQPTEADHAVEIGAPRFIRAEGAVPAWVALMAPAGARRNVWARIGSSDHISFERAGVPAFSTIQDYTGYDVRTHHTNADDYERVSAEDLRKSAAFLAGLLWQAASYEGELPGGGGAGEGR